MNCNNIYAVCYDTLYVFDSKKKAKSYFSECYYMSEGAEHERYASILVDLNFSNLGKDNVSKDCNEMSIKTNNYESKSLNIKLDESLSIEETIKFYEEELQPILEVSEKYDIDFNYKIPFENFGSDEECYTNSSFSSYYKEILEKIGVNIDSIYTDDWSDGKYKLVVNDEEFKLTAWDSFDTVIDNINSIIELSKTKDLEVEV